MKKKVFWLCLVCAVGVLLYFLLRPAPPGPEQDYYADFLPEDTVALVGLYDMEGVTEKFPGTPLGHFLSKPVMHEMMGEFGALDEDMAKYDALYDAVADTLTNQLFRYFFGDDALIAFCSPDPKRLQKNPEQELKYSLMVFGTSSSAGLISRLARFVMSKDVRRTEVAGLVLTQTRLDEDDEDEILYGYDNQGIIMLAYDPKKIARAVEQQKTGKTLRHSHLFSATETFWKGQEQEAGKGQMKGQVYARSYLNGLMLQELFSSFKQEKVQNIMDDLAGIE
ncbi:MAG: hypothetical protein D3908_07930, partial [Candidatus Electrothrix sp. AUS4]|nr:hypothetical protein [Candidatus Electrothrix sp. AUS4]